MFEVKIYNKNFFIKNSILKILFLIYMMVKKTIKYKNFETKDYWKFRAKQDNLSKVLFKNEKYNFLLRNKQREFLEDIIKSEEFHDVNQFKILDIGCGIGELSKIIVDFDTRINVDAVDYPDMIDVAKEKNYHPKIEYIKSAAEDYLEAQNKYDIIISSGLFSVIKDIPKLKKAILNCATMAKIGGKIIMLDSFHKWGFLARAKISSADIINYMNQLGFKLIIRRGMFFWPYRIYYAESLLDDCIIEKKFNQGEKLLKLLGENFWSDYKILVFEKL